MNGLGPNGQTDEAFFVLLVALCPGVTTLRLEGGLGVLRAVPHINEVLHELYDISQRQSQTSQTSTPAAGFYTIRDIHLKKLGDGRFIGAEDIVTLLHFPNVHRLTSDFLDPSISKGSDNEAYPVNSSVDVVEVSQCFAKDENLDALFQACPNAEILSIQWGMRDDNYRRFDWQDIGESITVNMPNLKHLTLNHEPDWDPEDPTVEYMMEMMTDDYLKNAHLPGLGSLRELEHFETLSLSSIALRGTHNDDVFDSDGFRDDDEDVEKHTLDGLLPPSLKQLHGKSLSLLCPTSADMFRFKSYVKVCVWTKTTLHCLKTRELLSWRTFPLRHA